MGEKFQTTQKPGRGSAPPNQGVYVMSLDIEDEFTLCQGSFRQFRLKCGRCRDVVATAGFATRLVCFIERKQRRGGAASRSQKCSPAQAAAFGVLPSVLVSERIGMEIVRFQWTRYKFAIGGGVDFYRQPTAFRVILVSH